MSILRQQYEEIIKQNIELREHLRLAILWTDEEHDVFNWRLPAEQALMQQPDVRSETDANRG